MPIIQEGSVWKLQAFLVMFPTSTWNQKCWKSVVKLVVKSSCDIKACHCLMNNDRVLVKFLRRKYYDQIISVKRDLQKVKLEDIWLRGSNSIFTDPSLCRYYRMVWSKYKRLLDLGKISNFYFFSEKQ